MNFEIPDALPVLSTGNHIPGSGKACIMDAISIVSGKPAQQDHPSCVHPLLRGMFIVVNDSLRDADRHKLWPIGLTAMGTGEDLSGRSTSLLGDDFTTDGFLLITASVAVARDFLRESDWSLHPKTNILGTHLLVLWLANPSRKIMQAAKWEHHPDCVPCRFLKVGIELAKGTSWGQQSKSVIERILTSEDLSSATRLRILTCIVNEFARSFKPVNEPVPPVVVNWDQLTADLGVVTR